MKKQTILLGCVIFVLIGLSAFTYWKNNQHQQQYNTFLQKTDWSIYTNRSTETTIENPAEKSIVNALQLAQQKEYTKALGQLYPLLEANPEYTELQLYVGIFYLYNNHFQEANVHLQQAYQQGNTIEKFDAAWFLALLNIHHEQKDKAKKYLQEVVAERGNYHLAAQELLEQL